MISHNDIIVTVDPKETYVSKYIIFYKFIFGLMEFLLGFVIVLLGRNATNLYNNFKSNELLEDVLPDDPQTLDDFGFRDLHSGVLKITSIMHHRLHK